MTMTRRDMLKTTGMVAVVSAAAGPLAELLFEPLHRLARVEVEGGEEQRSLVRESLVETAAR